MQNKTLFTDFYQLSMMQSFVDNNRHKDEVVMDMFFRKNPCGGGYTIISGINDVAKFIQNLKFSQKDLEYLSSLDKFSQKFLKILRDFKFSGEIWAVEEGSVMFPHEPILRVKANILEALYIETALLSIINFNSLIATKASRVCMSAKGDEVVEFGLRRSQGLEAGLSGARSAFVGGCCGTSNVMAGKKYGVSVLGTHSHAWVQSYESELEAFRAYAKTYPQSTLLLVDTYDTLKSGLPNALIVFNELKQKGYKPLGIRIDSGDLEYLSKKARKILDDAGFEDAKILASDNLDEYIIEHLKSIGAKIDIWGVGTKLITSYDCPSLGGVYKMAAIVKNGKYEPKMKFSEDPRKMNNPAYKQVHRLYDKKTNMAIADLISLDDESLDESETLEIFHPLYTYKRKKIQNFYSKKLLKPLFENGRLVRELCDVQKAKQKAQSEKKTFWHEYLRNIKPATYKVDLSLKLWKIRQKLIQNKNI